VAFCVSTYIFVLWIEFAPAFLEGISKYKQNMPSFIRDLNVEGLRTTLNKWLFVFIAIGVLLPTMHQSSLGTLMVIAGKKLSPLWQTGLLPLLFLISAITMGYAIVIFESVFSAVGFKRPIETPLLSKLAGVMPWLIIAYLVIRFADVLIQACLAWRSDSTLTVSCSGSRTRSMSRRLCSFCPRRTGWCRGNSSLAHSSCSLQGRFTGSMRSLSVSIQGTTGAISLRSRRPRSRWAS